MSVYGISVVLLSQECQTSVLEVLSVYWCVYFNNLLIWVECPHTLFPRPELVVEWRENQKNLRALRHLQVGLPAMVSGGTIPEDNGCSWSQGAAVALALQGTVERVNPPPGAVCSCGLRCHLRCDDSARSLPYPPLCSACSCSLSQSKTLPPVRNANSLDARPTRCAPVTFVC